MTVLSDFPAHPAHPEKRAEQASRSILQHKAGCQGLERPGSRWGLLGCCKEQLGALRATPAAAKDDEHST